MRWIAAALAAALLGGCTAQEQAQQRLIGSMQQGLTELSVAQQQRQELVDSLYEQRRRVLDDAFDQDVRTVERLEPEWVIEHRRAYMLACEALWAQQQESARAGERMQQNAKTISEGLSALAAMSRMRQQWGGWLEGEGDGNGK